MPTIHMETEKVYTVARKLDTDGAHMLSSLSHMQSSLSRLSYAWQGGNADQFHSDLSGLLKKIEVQIEELQTLSVRVSREAEEWEMADSGEYGSGGGGSKVYAMPAKITLQKPDRNYISRFIQGPLKDNLKITKDALKYVRFSRSFLPAWSNLMPSFLLGSGLPVAGFTSLSSFSVTVFERNLLRPIKDIRGVLSGHPTKSQGFGVAGIALSGGLNLISNWQKYGDTSRSKVAAGTVVDTAMDVAFTAAGSAVGAVAGGALGAAIGGPVGAIIGSKVGGFLGGMAGGWVSSQLKQTQIHEQIVSSGAQAIDGTGRAIMNTAQSAARAVDQFLARSFVPLFG